MSSSVPYSRRQPPKPIEPAMEVGRFQVQPGPPPEFRTQVLQDLDSVIGVRRRVNWTRSKTFGELLAPSNIWGAILHEVAHEYGFSPNLGFHDAQSLFTLWFLKDDLPNAHVLSAIEFAFGIVSKAEHVIASYQPEYRSSLTVEEAITDVNERFKQHGLNYFLDPESHIVRSVDSEFLHAEVVTSALTLIRQSGFQGAESEFSKALEHHRDGRQEEAINDAAKAFESALKQICDQRGWLYGSGKATAQNLIGIVIDNGLVPPWSGEQLTHLRMLLESGTPTVRNNVASHGSGSQPRTVPPHVAAYAIHTAAANIVFLIEAHAQQP